mmetsp:Transcript_20651/g.53129  ORF Transcript_20651/g.53129 Transcript_20651/m.53129 type:complete len:224 (+) Transcript_20651:427-1098(+)
MQIRTHAHTYTQHTYSKYVHNTLRSNSAFLLFHSAYHIIYTRPHTVRTYHVWASDGRIDVNRIVGMASIKEVEPASRLYQDGLRCARIPQVALPRECSVDTGSIFGNKACSKTQRAVKKGVFHIEFVAQLLYFAVCRAPALYQRHFSRIVLRGRLQGCLRPVWAKEGCTGSGRRAVQPRFHWLKDNAEYGHIVNCHTYHHTPLPIPLYVVAGAVNRVHKPPST